MPQGNHPGEQGFSLLEILVALFVVSLILVGIAQLIGFAVYVHSTAEDLTQTTALAADKMEELRDMSYAALVPGGSVDSDIPGFFDNPDIDADGTGDYTRRWEINDLVTHKRIRVRTISFLAKIGPPKDAIVVALVAPK